MSFEGGHIFFVLARHIAFLRPLPSILLFMVYFFYKPVRWESVTRDPKALCELRISKLRLPSTGVSQDLCKSIPILHLKVGYNLVVPWHLTKFEGVLNFSYSSDTLFVNSIRPTVEVPTYYLGPTWYCYILQIGLVRNVVWFINTVALEHLSDL